MTYFIQFFRNRLMVFLLFLSGAGCVSAQAPFITEWITSDGTVLIPTESSSTYNYSLTWTNLTTPGAGDGSETGITGNYLIENLTNGNTYRIEITGNFPRFYMNNNSTHRSKLYNITQWGDINWSSFENAFYGAANLEVSATDVPDLSGVSDLTQMFRSCINLTGAGANWNWNTETINNMNGLFYTADSFNQDIGNWNTQNVTNMTRMFLYATSFNQDIGNWNTSNVTTMSFMFNYATGFNRDIGNWNTSNVTTMSYMFNYATSFNQDIGNWNVNNVTHMQNMFTDAGLSYCNYDATLNGWLATGVQNGISFDGGNSQYTTAARQTLIDDHNWTITDGGEYELPDATFTYPQSAYCIGDINTTPVFGTGAVAGEFSATPSGLAIDATTGEIDLTASIPGIYEVVNTISYPDAICPDVTAVFEITVNSLPVVTASADITEICAGEQIELSAAGADSYEWDNGLGTGDSHTITLANEGTYTYSATGTDANGCTATDEVQVIVTEVSTEVNVTGNTLTAEQTGATYQWLDCDDNNAPIAGETQQSFTPSANGNYAVEISYNGCTEVSSCMSITTVNINNITLQNEISLYPNPANEWVYVQNVPAGMDMEVIDLLGKTVYTTTTVSNTVHLNINTLQDGIYILNLKENNRVVASKKFVVAR